MATKIIGIPKLKTITLREEPTETMQNLITNIMHYIGTRSCASLSSEYIIINCDIDLTKNDRESLQQIVGNLVDLFFFEGDLEKLDHEDDVYTYVKL